MISYEGDKNIFVGFLVQMKSLEFAFEILYLDVYLEFNFYEDPIFILFFFISDEASVFHNVFKTFTISGHIQFDQFWAFIHPVGLAGPSKTSG